MLLGASRTDSRQGTTRDPARCTSRSSQRCGRPPRVGRGRARHQAGCRVRTGRRCQPEQPRLSAARAAPSLMCAANSGRAEAGCDAPLESLVTVRSRAASSIELVSRRCLSDEPAHRLLPGRERDPNESGCRPQQSGASRFSVFSASRGQRRRGRSTSCSVIRTSACADHRRPRTTTDGPGRARRHPVPDVLADFGRCQYADPLLRGPPDDFLRQTADRFSHSRASVCAPKSLKRHSPHTGPPDGRRAWYRADRPWFSGRWRMEGTSTPSAVVAPAPCALHLLDRYEIQSARFVD